MFWILALVETIINLIFSKQFQPAPTCPVVPAKISLEKLQKSKHFTKAGIFN